MKRFLAFSLIISLLLSSCSFQKSPHQSVEYLMDTVIEQCWYGNDADIVINEISEELHYIDDNFSQEKIDPNSQLVKDALTFCQETNWILDIRLGKLINLWNITGDHPTVPTEDEIKEALSDKSILDLGAVAKGYAADRCKEIAQKYDVTGWISLGGNMYVKGKNPQTGKNFKIGIRDPFKSDNAYFATAIIPNTTMSTAGTYERFFEENGVKYHHILDPRTGYPAKSDLCSVTVILENGILADGIATTVLILGSDYIDDYVNKYGCKIIAVTNDKEVILSHEDKTISVLSYTVVSGNRA